MDLPQFAPWLSDSLVSHPPIYLDCHATTPVDPVVLAAMHPWWQEGFGNPHSAEHWFGWQAHQAVEDARTAIASLIGAAEEEILFTSGATEANNLALIGGAQARYPQRTHVIVSAIEHKCVLESAAALQRRGWQVDVLPVDQEGRVCLDMLAKLVTSNTALVSIMAVNNEIGTIQSLAAIGQLCAAYDVWFHCDAAQALAAMPLDVLDQHIDLLSLSSHKIYGPKGVGALWARMDVRERLHPINYGGGQEQGIRSGTLSTPLCVGFGEACRQMERQRHVDAVHMTKLCERLWQGIQQAAPAACLNGPPAPHRHPGNLNIRFVGLDARLLLGKLQPTLAASTGSACTTGIPEPSHVLRAIGLAPVDADSSLRLGLGRFTRADEIERAIDLFATVIQTMVTEGL